ncbi:MAG TPA: toll/interleukin-1 receptor domain-containing protein [Burkholderiales bacterium]|jgi:hypothetical protein|nr:toll/interleukin-1 receptor domain-containing protein [Burkholderiales bacterium]
MRVFISWSGENSTSQRFAEGFADWLQNILPPVRPFYSTDSVKKGDAWFQRIAKELDESDFGILSLTPANANSPWINFEAGAIAKKVGRGKVVPILLGMQFGDLHAPLSMFNGARPNRDDLLRVAKSINGELGSATIEARRLERAFDKWWPDLEKTIADSLKLLNIAPEAARRPTIQDSDAKLHEVLELVRVLAKSREAKAVDPVKAPISSPARTPASDTDKRLDLPFFTYKLVDGVSLDTVNGALTTSFPEGARTSKVDRNGNIKVYVPAGAGPADAWRIVLDSILRR